MTSYVDCILWPLYKLEIERKEEEQLGEATARHLEEEEHEQQLSNSQQVKFDEEMAEVLSQDFILKQIVSTSYEMCISTKLLYQPVINNREKVICPWTQEYTPCTIIVFLDSRQPLCEVLSCRMTFLSWYETVQLKILCRSGYTIESWDFYIIGSFLCYLFICLLIM